MSNAGVTSEGERQQTEPSGATEHIRRVTSCEVHKERGAVAWRNWKLQEHVWQSHC